MASRGARVASRRRRRRPPCSPRPAAPRAARRAPWPPARGARGPRGLAPMAASIASASPSPRNSFAVTSARSPCRSSAVAVAGPMAASRAAPNARASPSDATMASHVRSTPFALVKATHAYAPGAQLLHGARERRRIGRRLEDDGRHDDRLGPLFAQQRRGAARLPVRCASRARHEHALAEERLPLEPPQLVVGSAEATRSSASPDRPVARAAASPAVVTTTRCDGSPARATSVTTASARLALDDPRATSPARALTARPTTPANAAAGARAHARARSRSGTPARATASTSAQHAAPTRARRPGRPHDALARQGERDELARRALGGPRRANDDVGRRQPLLGALACAATELAGPSDTNETRPDGHGPRSYPLLTAAERTSTRRRRRRRGSAVVATSR